MIKNAIVEDNDNDAAKLETQLNQFGEEHKEKLVSQRYSNGPSFLKDFKPGMFDIIFLDIEMPDENGMDVAKDIRRIDDKVIIIFVTNLAQYAIYGYEVNAWDFILKSSDYYQVSIKLDRALARIHSQQQEVMMPIESDSKKIYLKTKDIKYIETSGRKIVFHTINGDYSTYGTIKDITNQLNKSNFNSFVRCNSYLIINLNYVSSLEGSNVIIDKEKLVVSRPRKKELIEKLNKFMNLGAI